MFYKRKLGGANARVMLSPLLLRVPDIMTLLKEVFVKLCASKNAGVLFNNHMQWGEPKKKKKEKKHGHGFIDEDNEN